MVSISNPIPSSSRSLLLFAVAAVLFSVLLVPITTGHEVPDSPYGIFFADDEDEGTASDELGSYGNKQFSDAQSDPETTAQRGDFTFDNANPIAEFEQRTLNYNEWRESQLEEYEFDRHSSRGPIMDCVPTGSFRSDDHDDNENPQFRDCQGTTYPNYKSWTNDHMKDAHTTILGAEAGTELNFRRISGQGQQDDSQELTGSVSGDNTYQDEGPTLAVPPAGQLYVQSDFRLDRDELDAYECGPADWEYNYYDDGQYVLEWDSESEQWVEVWEPDLQRERVDGSKTCTARSYYSESVEHTVVHYDGDGNPEQIGFKQDDDLAGAQITYSGLETDGIEHIQVHSDYTYVIEVATINRDWSPGTGWQTASESISYNSQTNSHSSDRQPVDTMHNKDLEVTQTLVDLENHDQTYLVIDIDGPETLDERRLWSRMYMGECPVDARDGSAICYDDQYITNTWGVYSARQYEHMNLRDRWGSNTVHNPEPQFPTLRTLPGDPAPRVRVVEDSDEQFNRARVQSTQTTQPLDGDIPVLKPNVNLRQETPTLINQISVRNAPGKVINVEDIHGDTIPVSETNEVPGRVPEIYLEDVNDSDVQITVEDPVTGDPVPFREVTLEGTEQNVVFTNSDGEATVTRNSAYLQAQTTSDRFNQHADVYYVSAVNQKDYHTNPAVMGMVYELAFALLFATPFIGLYMWLQNIRRENEE